MASDDVCMFCGAAPCECGGKKKAKPKAKAAPKKRLVTPTTEAQAGPRKKMAAPPVKERNKVKVASASKPGRSKEGDQEFWDAVRNLVAEDMLPPEEMQRVLSAYPRRPM